MSLLVNHDWFKSECEDEQCACHAFREMMGLPGKPGFGPVVTLTGGRGPSIPKDTEAERKFTSRMPILDEVAPVKPPDWSKVGEAPWMGAFTLKKRRGAPAKFEWMEKDDKVPLPLTASGDKWPLVTPDDDGIRPGGRPDECFYCHQEVDTPHTRDCTIVTKLVRLRYSIEVDVRVPHKWTDHDIEFHRNDSSWCANNAIGEIKRMTKRKKTEAHDPCLCDRFTATVVKTLDDKPRRKRRKVKAD